MDPIVVGRVENPEQLDLQPLEIEVVGYTLERKEVAETFRFRPVPPTGAALAIVRQTMPNGNVPLGPVLDYLDKCLLEEDQQRFQDYLNRDDVMIEQAAVIDLYTALTEFYTARPTRPPSDSASTGSSAKRTSRAAARSAASPSKTSR